MWFHEISLNQFSSASENLHTSALLACPEEDTDLTSNRKPLSFVERRRLLYLSKIAATAGKDIDYEVKVARIDADIRILKLQEEIVQHDPEHAQGKYKSKLLRPSELIEMCLKRASCSFNIWTHVLQPIIDVSNVAMDYIRRKYPRK